jgi:hypothetical protein
MKKLGSFDDYLNEKDDSLNESVLMMVGLSILISLGIKGLRKIVHNIALNRNIEPDKFKKVIDDIVSGAKENVSNDKSEMDKWGEEMMKRYETGEIKNLDDLSKYIDSSRSIFKN